MTTRHVRVMRRSEGIMEGVHGVISSNLIRKEKRPRVDPDFQ